MPAETDQDRFAALQWAASLRGATDPDEALDWMAARGLVSYTDGGEITLTGEGRVRGDDLFDALNRVPVARQARQRRTPLLLIGLGLLVWRMRRAKRSEAR